MLIISQNSNLPSNEGSTLRKRGGNIILLLKNESNESRATENPLRVLSGSLSSRSLGPFGYCPDQRMKGSRPGHPHSEPFGISMRYIRVCFLPQEKAAQESSDRPDCVLLETSCDFLPLSPPSGISSQILDAMQWLMFYVGGEKKLV